MKVAILSDLHDNYNNLLKALDILKKEKISEMIFCGDVCAPSVFKKMIEQFSGNIYMVFGNVDGDRIALESLVVENDSTKIFGDEAELELNNKKIFFTHKPDLADEKAKQKKYDLICHGHTHEKREEKINNTLIINPGSVGGLFAAPSFVILDLENMIPNFIELSEFDI